VGIFGKIRLPWVSLESLKESWVLPGVVDTIFIVLQPKNMLLTTEREKNQTGQHAGLSGNMIYHGYVITLQL